MLTKRARRREQPARRWHPLRHHQRPAAQRHGHAAGCASARHADRRLQRRAFRQAGPLDPSRKRCLPTSPPRRSSCFRAHGLDVWVYRGNDWLVARPAPARRSRGLDRQVSPMVVADVAANPTKSLRSSASATTRQGSAARPTPRRPVAATANRSQPHYLDITNKDANKGAVVEFCRGASGCRRRRSPNIGDYRPTPMFKRSGLASP